MWGEPKAQTAPELDYKKVNEELRHTHKLEVADLNNTHKLELKEKEFELKHFKDEEVKKLQAELSSSKQDNAVLRKENEMLQKITDLNADIIDIKSLVANLIDKLPTINLQNLTLQNGSKHE
jgi:hypothetical protein